AQLHDLRLPAPQLAALLPRRAERDASLRPRERFIERARVERLLRRAEVLRDRALGLPAFVEVLREDDAVALARGLEPFAGLRVRDRAIGVGEHAIRGLAHDLVTKEVLLFARKFRFWHADEDLARGELVEVIAERARVDSKERLERAAPRRAAEDARGAERLAELGLEAVDARRDHRE